MYANREKNEHEAMVARVRKNYGNSVEVGGYNSHDILNLKRLDADRERHEAKAREERPTVEAAGRMSRTRERAMKAWRTIKDGTEKLAKNRRVHLVNGASAEMLDPADMPRWSEQMPVAVSDYDRLNAEAALLATELETRASKVGSYLAAWEQMTPEEQNRSLILAIADRLDRLEAPTQ